MAHTSRDGARYVRIQKSHNLIFWLIANWFGIGIPFLIYYTFSPNHFWYA